MVESVRAGESMRSVARAFGVSLLTVQRWMRRAEGRPLDSVDFTDRTSEAHVVANRTGEEVEVRIRELRKELADHSDLGEYGAEAIHEKLREEGFDHVPCARTIHRILVRGGDLDGKRRVRHPPPPPGWYLPDVACGLQEVDQFDVVTGLVIEGGTDVEVLNGVSIVGGLIGCWPCESVTSQLTTQRLLEHWTAFGLPGYAQFDNDSRFAGTHRYTDIVGRTARFCLSLGVTPVFAPVRETGFQAAVESLNNRWQAKVWDRFHHETLEDLIARSDRYVAAARAKAVLRQERAPDRHPFPSDLNQDPKAPLSGRIIYIRRTNEHGQVSFLKRSFDVAAHWVHRLVRCEVDLDGQTVSFYALRRREPAHQPLLATEGFRLRDHPTSIRCQFPDSHSQ